MKLGEVLATSNSDHTNILCKQLLTLVNSYHINGAEYVAIKACIYTDETGHIKLFFSNKPHCSTTTMK